MNLITRLRLSYLFLVVLLLAIAGGSALEFHRYGTRLERDLGQAYASADAAVTMLASFEREREAVEALLHDRGAGPEALAAAREALDLSIARIEGTTALESEGPIRARIRERVDRFRALSEELLAADSIGIEAIDAYETQVYPEIAGARAAIVEVLALNHRVMSDAGQAARQGAWRRALGLAIVVTIALLSFTLLSRLLQRHVIAPLDDLRKTADAVALGETQRRVLVDADDELGVVGRQLNALLDRQEDLLSESAGRLTAQKQLLLALVRACDPPVAIVALDGHLVASNLPEEDAGAVADLSAELAERARGQNGGEVRLPARGSRIAVCRLLTTTEGRPTGWLVRLESL